MAIPSIFPVCDPKVVEVAPVQREDGKLKGGQPSGGTNTNLNPWLPSSIVNDFRTARVAEVLSDFHSIQYCIAAFPVDPPNMDDYYTEGWTALRQCHLDGQRILNCGADTSVPETSGGPEEQAKAELKQSVRLPPSLHISPPYTSPSFTSRTNSVDIITTGTLAWGSSATREV